VALGLLLITLGTDACSLTLDASNLGVPATLASDAAAPPEGTAFQVTQHAVYGFWGAVTLSHPSLQKALASQLAGGKSVANVRVRVHSSFGGVLITVLTGGLVIPRSITIQGVVVDR
jgi:hypothetical protein